MLYPQGTGKPAQSLEQDRAGTTPNPFCERGPLGWPRRGRLKMRRWHLMLPVLSFYRGASQVGSCLNCLLSATGQKQRENMKASCTTEREGIPESITLKCLNRAKSAVELQTDRYRGGRRASESEVH